MDSKIFDDVLQDLRKRPIFKRKDIYYLIDYITDLKNTKSELTSTKLSLSYFKVIHLMQKNYKQISYPLDVVSINKISKQLKKDIGNITSILFNKLNGNELKYVWA